MNLRLLQAIQALESERKSCTQKAEEYADLQGDVNSECSQALQGVIERFKVLERGITDSLAVLRAEQMKQA